MTKEDILFESVDKKVTVYEEGKVIIEGKSFNIAKSDVEPVNDLVADLSKKLNENYFSFLNINLANLLVAHRVLFGVKSRLFANATE